MSSGAKCAGRTHTPHSNFMIELVHPTRRRRNAVQVEGTMQAYAARVPPRVKQNA